MSMLVMCGLGGLVFPPLWFGCLLALFAARCDRCKGTGIEKLTH